MCVADDFSTRLHVLAAYMYVAQSNYNGAHTAFGWDINAVCPGHFLEVFDTLDSVMFATNTSRFALLDNAHQVFDSSSDPFSAILKRNKFGRKDYGSVMRTLYAQFIPSFEIMSKVSQFVHLHGICSAPAVYINSLDGIERYISAIPVHQHFFLLTDSFATQKAVLLKYDNRKIITYDAVPTVLGLDSIVINILVAAHASSFSGPHASSVSEAVTTFAHIAKHKNWCE